MKETLEKQVTHYSIKTFQELLAMAMAGDREAAAEIIRRQEAQKAEIESLKIKANSKVRKEKAEKTPIDLARDNAYFRCALLVKQFGEENVTMQALTVASALLGQGLSQGNLRQAYNRVQQILKAQAVEESVFPAWIVQAAGEIPLLDENLKLEEEQEKVEEIKAVIQKYLEEQLPPPPAEIFIPATAATEQPENSEPVNTPVATTPAKKASKK